MANIGVPQYIHDRAHERWLAASARSSNSAASTTTNTVDEHSESLLVNSTFENRSESLTDHTIEQAEPGTGIPQDIRNRAHERWVVARARASESTITSTDAINENSESPPPSNQENEVANSTIHHKAEQQHNEETKMESSSSAPSIRRGRLAILRGGAEERNSYAIDEVEPAATSKAETTNLDSFHWG